MTARKGAERHTLRAPAEDAIALLQADHRSVQQRFDDDDAQTQAAPDRKRLVAQSCSALSVHPRIEEEIFYPQVNAALKEKRLVPEAIVQHAGVKALISQLEGAEPDGSLVDARLEVLAASVQRHASEQRAPMFPKALASALDMGELGGRLIARKEDLLAQGT